MKILVGYDGSNTAKEALKLAQKRAKNFGGEVEVIRSMAQSNKLGHEDIRKAEISMDCEVWEIFNQNYLQPKTHLVLTRLSHGEELVEFAKKKVDLSKALFYYPIPDSVMIEIPREGWEDVPSYLKKYRRKRMEFFGFYDEIFKN